MFWRVLSATFEPTNNQRNRHHNRLVNSKNPQLDPLEKLPAMTQAAANVLLSWSPRRPRKDAHTRGRGKSGVKAQRTRIALGSRELILMLKMFLGSRGKKVKAK